MLFNFCNITFNGQAFFINNTSTISLNALDFHYGGGAIYGQNSRISFTGLATFAHNQAKHNIIISNVYRIVMSTGGAILSYI